jgi:hypothetical protein
MVSHRFTFQSWMPGGEWGFRQQVSNNAIPPPAHAATLHDTVQQLLDHAVKSRDNLKYAAISEHKNYWDGAAPGQYFEHDRFSVGWSLGYNDSLTFFGYRCNHIPSGTIRDGGDKIGLRDLWIKRREKEYEASEVQTHGQTVDKSYFWEFCHGLQRGIQDFERSVGL